ncbi:MAG: hypothetical protein ACTSP3_13385, partial [Candidatus Heimdallarchaeaceae archaeon]
RSKENCVIILGEKKGKIEIFCSKCGAIARFTCRECGKPLCGRCRTREKKGIVEKITNPEGLCKECAEKRRREYKTGEKSILAETIIRYVEPIRAEPRKEKSF